MKLYKHIRGSGLIVCLLVSATVANATVDPTGLIGYWKFDDAVSSTTAADSSGKGYDGTVVDNSTGANNFGVAGMVGTAWQTASDGAAWPNMKSDYIQLPASTGNELRLVTSKFTVLGWFKYEDVDNSGNVSLFDSHISGANGLQITAVSGNPSGGQSPELQFQIGTDLASISAASLPGGSGDWEVGMWYFFAARFDASAASSQMILWLARSTDDWASRSGTAATRTIPPGDPGLEPLLGRDTAPGAFIGVRDEFSIWSNRTLTSDEVGEIFEANQAGNPLPLPEPSIAVLLGLGALVLPLRTCRKNQELVVPMIPNL